MRPHPACPPEEKKKKQNSDEKIIGCNNDGQQVSGVLSRVWKVLVKIKALLSLDGLRIKLSHILGKKVASEFIIDFYRVFVGSLAGMIYRIF